MSFKRNIIASYASQIYVTLVGIVILPMYLAHMGAEAYGLVGFFTMLQAWFNLLDMGLTPTVAREAARFRVGITDAESYRKLLRALQLIFIAIAIIGAGIMLAFTNSIASEWLNVESLPLADVEIALKLIVISVALRWVSGLYKGCVSGAEKWIWLSNFNILIATLRFVGALPVLIWIGNSPVIFFSYQLFIAAIELTVITRKAHSLFPVMPDEKILGWSIKKLFLPVAPVLKFSLSIAFTSFVWILITQLDKLILSKLLTLSDYGYFTLAVLAAGGVLMISGPISSALMPRLAGLQAVGDQKGLISLYREATRLVVLIALPACLTLAIFAEQILWAWTGDAHAARNSAPILRLYALGNGFLSISAFPYYLQYAKGDLKMHILGNILFILLLVPLLIWSTYQYGAIGSGYAWLISNAIYFFVWIPFVHKKFVKGLHSKWLMNDLGMTVVLGCIIGYFLRKFSSWPDDRFGVILFVIAGGLILLCGCAMSFKLTTNLKLTRKLLSQ